MLVLPLGCCFIYLCINIHRFNAYIKAVELDIQGLLPICGGLLLIAIAKVFGPVLAVVLDVINWLRYIPAKNTRRARIMARFLSLLAKIEEESGPRDATVSQPGRPRYDKLIILAHSQGTIVATETLRSLHFREPGMLANLPDIYLFTMGCPLSQLYARRFPDLFKWAQDDDVHEKETPKPSPRELFKVKYWLNAFGTLDYVGRQLWYRFPKPESDEKSLKEVTSPEKRTYWGGLCEEFCVGEAAHTHYWDIASPVAKELDELIKKPDVKI